MLVISGARSKIAQCLIELLVEHPAIEEEIYRTSRDWNSIPISEDRYFFCAGIIRAKTLEQQTKAEINETLEVNELGPVRVMEKIFDENEKARVCVIGSESAFVRSFDGAYTASKRGLHGYVEDKKLGPYQQLVAISPGIIEDAGMTTRRTDLDTLERRKEAHPKKRFIKSIEVARLARFLLYEDEGYISNVVIRMNGGEHVSRRIP